MTEQQAMDKLLSNIKRAMPTLEKLQTDVNGHWGSEDMIYRYYHQSFKVFHIQSLTIQIVTVLKTLGDAPLNGTFLGIVAKGTGKEFSMEDNARWDEATQPLLQAFFHASYFLDMLIRYGKKLDEAPQMLPSGWASVLCLYGMR